MQVKIKQVSDYKMGHKVLVAEHFVNDADNPCFSPSTPPKYQAVILTMFTQMALIYLPRDRGKENIVNFEMYEGFSFGCLTYQILAVKSCLGKAVYIVFQMFQNIDKNFSLTG